MQRIPKKKWNLKVIWVIFIEGGVDDESLSSKKYVKLYMESMRVNAMDNSSRFDKIGLDLHSQLIFFFWFFEVVEN